MTYQITVVGIRLLALYIAFQGMAGSFRTVAAIGLDQEVFSSLLWFFAAPLVVGLVLWGLSKPIGNLVVLGLASSDILSSENTNFLVAGTALIGVFLVAWAIPEIIRASVGLYEVSKFSTASKIDAYGELLASIAKGTIGLALVAGKNRVSKLIRFVRYGGTSA